MWKKTILKNQVKLQEKLHKELPAILERYNFKMYLAQDIKAKRLKKFIDKLEKIKVKSAYNVQIAVDAEYIVATEIFNDRTEILLLCLAYNIQKLHNKTAANRQGQFLHEIKAN